MFWITRWNDGTEEETIMTQYLKPTNVLLALGCIFAQVSIFALVLQ